MTPRGRHAEYQSQRGPRRPPRELPFFLPQAQLLQHEALVAAPYAPRNSAARDAHRSGR